MHDHLILFIAGFLGTVVLIAGYGCWTAGRVGARHDAAADRDYAALRTPGMGDLSSEPTPIFDQLCLERLDASLDERPVYDIDDDFHSGGAA